ncbi:MAG: hypothetical protein ACRD44_03270, partial [Bryobacteraceae bacterium]
YRMRERLFDYHQRINRERRERTREIRRSVDMLRKRVRIRELTAKIDAATSSVRSISPGITALRAMGDQREASRAAIENCATVTPEVRESWVNRLNAIQSSASGENPGRIRNLAAEVDGLAQALSCISDNLAVAASKRGLPLNPFRFAPDWSPLSNPEPLPPLRTARAASFELMPFSMLSRYPLADPGRDLLADDLKAIHDQIADSGSVSPQLRDAWLDQLGRIDKRGSGFALPSAGVEKAEKLASDIKVAQSDLVLLAISLRDYARKYQAWWDE